MLVNRRTLRGKSCFAPDIQSHKGKPTEAHSVGKLIYQPRISRQWNGRKRMQVWECARLLSQKWYIL